MGERTRCYERLTYLFRDQPRRNPQANGRSWKFLLFLFSFFLRSFSNSPNVNSQSSSYPLLLLKWLFHKSISPQIFDLMLLNLFSTCELSDLDSESGPPHKTNYHWFQYPQLIWYVKYLPCTISTWRCEKSDGWLLTIVVVPIHKILCQSFWKYFKDRYTGLSFPFITTLVTPFRGETFQVNQSSTSNSNSILLISLSYF